MERKKLRLLVCVLATGLIAGFANADIESGLTGYWSFEEGGGDTTADMSGNGHIGTLTNGPTWVNGPEALEGALGFGGTNEHVDCGPFIPTTTGQLTISAWTYFEGTGDKYTIIGKRTLWADMMFQLMVRYRDGYPCLMLIHGMPDPYRPSSCDWKDEEGVRQVHIPVGEWCHVAVTFDGTDCSAYINNELIATDEWAIPPGTDCHVTIGASSNDGEYWKGLLDDVRLYDRPLSADDVQELYLFRSEANYNYYPQVEAGDYQSLSWTETHTAQLDATVSDDGKPYQESPPAEPCTPVGLTLTWTQISGPGVVTFDPCKAVEDPIATFTEAGFYELRLRGYDGEKDACDVVAIYIRSNNDPIAYWDFEEGVDTTVNDSANENDGIFAGTSDPNWVDGWITGAANNKAIEFYGNSSRVEITADETIDPNLNNLTYEITVASWINIASTDWAWAGIVTRSDNAWRLAMRDNDRKFHFAIDGGSGGRFVNGEIEVGLGEWCHVAGVFDGSEIRLYVNGVLDVTKADSGSIALTDLPVWLGANSEYPDDTETFDGKIDDTRIYGYALSEAQIMELVDMGMGVPPRVDAGMNAMFYVQNDQLQLDGTVWDDGKPAAAIIEWTQESGPGTAAFSNNTIEDPTVTFSQVGTYVLRLTATDSLGSAYDEVEITVEDPICADVAAGGLLIAGDVSGPDGTPDCRVNLYDFAAFAGYWLQCNDPQDPACDFPY